MIYLISCLDGQLILTAFPTDSIQSCIIVSCSSSAVGKDRRGRQMEKEECQWCLFSNRWSAEDE